ncbi:hypothetical protein HN858_02370 [Candidatus Falkowbacteria bacterium]|jgi:hypothetical protein|nr:hypothetical protein [Candidatus Falkowbacteria bacterium]MBT5503201.1 hypothetical protein [Candidatus Falkowbacteria bacterium]MBT6573892.1 hypothetical protein [Candidatus Falkowbacteria bacterium]MBT7348501.1 hypothetical protein [Candidatus Falkowbacteria bacterium]MBT7500834.1 hypothetical protein [Candidatus Falkowbacteria bacterium]
MFFLDYRWAVKFLDQGIELWHRAPRGWASRWESCQLIESSEQLNVVLDCTGLTLGTLLLEPENNLVMLQISMFFRSQEA